MPGVRNSAAGVRFKREITVNDGIAGLEGGPATCTGSGS